MGLAFLLALSGAAGLLLQSVLLRHLTGIVGSASLATATVLAGFMGGLAAGAAFLGPGADRSARPVRRYARLEAVIAGTGAIAVVATGPGREALLAAVRAAEAYGAGSAVAFGLAFLFVLLPSVPMGGTLPAAVRGLEGARGALLPPLGALYAANTLGGAVGALAAGAWLFDRIGILATGIAGASLAAAVAVGAAALDRRRAPVDSGPRAPVSAPDTIFPAAARRAALAAATLGGASILGYEVVWTRLLTLPLRSYAYSFSLMLAVLLFALVLGGALASFLGRRGVSPAPLLGWATVGSAAWVGASLLFLPDLLEPVEAGSPSLLAFLASGGLRAFLVVGPATLLSGLALPLAARVAETGPDRPGRAVGTAFGWNGAGAVLGSLATGFLLLPALGAPRTLAVLAALHAASGVFVLSVSSTRRAVAIASLVASSCLGLALLPASPFVDGFLRATRAKEKLGEILYFHEGAEDTIAVVRRRYGFHDPEAKSLLTNGFAMTATVKPVWRYMAAEGHLPVLLSEDPSRVLVLCVGTGITLSAIASHHAVAEIDAADLSAGVLAALPFFAEENGRAFEDPRVRLLHRDGRLHLERTTSRYGVITVEPPPPIVAGSVHLYTWEFYQASRRRLRPGGIVAQWLPLHGQSLASARMTAATFLQAFPHVELWLPSVRDGVLVGSDRPLVLRGERLRDAWRTPRTRENLEAAHFETPEALLATRLLDREGLARWVGDAPLLTDDRPRMEFFTRLGPNMRDGEIATLLDVAAASDPGALADLDAALLVRVEEERLAHRLYLEAEVRDRGPAGVEAARRSRGTRFYRYRLGCAPEQLEALRRETGDGPRWRSQAARCATLAVPPAPGES